MIFPSSWWSLALVKTGCPWSMTFQSTCRRPLTSLCWRALGWTRRRSCYLRLLPQSRVKFVALPSYLEISSDRLRPVLNMIHTLHSIIDVKVCSAVSYYFWILHYIVTDVNISPTTYCIVIILLNTTIIKLQITKNYSFEHGSYSLLHYCQAIVSSSLFIDFVLDWHQFWTNLRNQNRTPAVYSSLLSVYLALESYRDWWQLWTLLPWSVQPPFMTNSSPQSQRST